MQSIVVKGWMPATVQKILRQDPFCGTIFVFRLKPADRMKMLVYDGTTPVPNLKATVVRFSGLLCARGRLRKPSIFHTLAAVIATEPMPGRQIDSLRPFSCSKGAAEAQQLSRSGGSRALATTGLRIFANMPFWKNHSLRAQSPTVGCFPTGGAHARGARSKRSTDSKCSKVGSKVEVTPCFNFSLAKKLHPFRDARS